MDGELIDAIDERVGDGIGGSAGAGAGALLLLRGLGDVDLVRGGLAGVRNLTGWSPWDFGWQKRDKIKG